jgi:hypothetical protein
MQSLRSLDLSLNESLASLPPGSYLQQLETLDLSRCDFKSVGFMPPGCHLRKITHLSWNCALHSPFAIASPDALWHRDVFMGPVSCINSFILGMSSCGSVCCWDLLPFLLLLVLFNMIDAPRHMEIPSRADG